MLFLAHIVQLVSVALYDLLTVCATLLCVEDWGPAGLYNILPSAWLHLRSSITVRGLLPAA